MRELLDNFLAFVGEIAAFFWTAFLEDPAFLFSAIAQAPAASGFELLFVAFLLGIGVALAVGVVRAVAAASPVPFIRTVEAYTRFFAYVGAGIILVLIVAMVYEVVSRYFFGAPTKWAFEMAYMLMGTSFMFGIAFCLQMRRHIRVDFLYDHVGPRAKAGIDLFGYVFLVPMLLWLCGGLWEYFHAAYRVDEVSGESAWNPIIWPFKFSFVIGFVLLLLQTLLEILKAVLVLAGREAPLPPELEGFG